MLVLLLRLRLPQELAGTGSEQVVPGWIQSWNTPPWALRVALAEDGWSRKGWRASRNQCERWEGEHNPAEPPAEDDSHTWYESDRGDCPNHQLPGHQSGHGSSASGSTPDEDECIAAIPPWTAGSRHPA